MNHFGKKEEPVKVFYQVLFFLTLHRYFLKYYSARSLTGHYCVNKVHATETEMGDFSLSIMKHTSQIRYVSTCNCGFRQAQRLDPFEIKVIYYD